MSGDANLTESASGLSMDWRRIATRFDRNVKAFMAAAALAAVVNWWP